MGQVPDAAVKCQHCGEWVDGRPSGPPADGIGHAANRWVSNSTALGWAGLALAVFVVLVVFLPMSCEMRSRRDPLDQFPGVPGDLRRP